MTSRHLKILGVLLLGTPLWSPAAEVEPPLTRDALFDLAPAEASAGTRGGADEPVSLPDSKDELFALEPEAPPSGGAQEGAPDDLPATKEALFDEFPAAARPEREVAASGVPTRVRGYFQAEAARTYADPEHWSKALGRLELGTQGRWQQGVQWKLSGRVDFDAIYDLTDHYQRQVRNDQRAEFQLRETYLDFAAGGWDWRIGRQHIVWGEMVGLFFADVVSAKDFREFILPDFQVLRIPQWAARAEYFLDDFHAEFVWIPFPSYDEIGKPRNFSRAGSGADFYPYPPAVAPTILTEDKPGYSLDHTNFGVRVTQLSKGWDMSGFAYTSMNSAPTFYRTGVNTFTPRHDRIWQLGGTLAKDFSSFVLKAEAIYSHGRRYNLTTNLADPDGVVRQNNLDWVVGLDFNPSSDTRVNAQLFQRYFFNHNPDIIPDRAENGMSLLVNHKYSNNWSVEALLVHSLNRSDWMLRPKVVWGFQPNWKLTLGVDIFGGPQTGFFGQYDSNDRAYAEVRYDF